MTSIHHNAENRPVRWTNAETGTVITMTFDSQGRRTEYKSVTNGVQNTWLRFLYDGYLCIQVLYSNAPYNVFEEFVWDPTEPVATRPLVFRYAPNSLNLFYAFDGNKNVSDASWRTGRGRNSRRRRAFRQARTKTAMPWSPRSPETARRAKGRNVTENILQRQDRGSLGASQGRACRFARRKGSVRFPADHGAESQYRQMTPTPTTSSFLI